MPATLPEEGELVELVLDIRPGSTMRGTLYDTAGNPCAGTITAKLSDQVDSFMSDGYGKAKADGAFQLHIEEGGPHLFFGTGGDFPTTGTVTTEFIDIDLAAPPQDFELHLVGPGSLRGMVLDADGRPSAGLQRGKVVGKGTVAYDLPVEKEYIVSVIAPGQSAQSVRFVMPKNAGRVEQTFVLDRPKPPGKLLVRVLDPDGNPVEKHLSVNVLDPETGVSVASRWNFYQGNGPDPWPAKFALPQGIYRLEIESIANIESHHGTLMSPRAFGDYRTTLTLAAGETQELTATLSAPAWIDLEVLGEASESDRTAALELDPWISSRQGKDNYEELLTMHALRATPELWRTDGYPLDVEFARYGFEGTSAAGTHVYGFLPLGMRQKTEALPPGTYKLIVRLPGGRTRSQDVVLTPGSVLPISMDFGNE